MRRLDDLTFTFTQNNLLLCCSSLLTLEPFLIILLGGFGKWSRTGWTKRVGHAYCSSPLEVVMFRRKDSR